MTGLIRAGDVRKLTELLTAHPSLASERIANAEMSCTAWHVAADWPGHYPSVAETVAALAAAGAPIDGRFAGPHRETALHWAASSNDVNALDALLDAGAYTIQVGSINNTVGSVIVVVQRATPVTIGQLPIASVMAGQVTADVRLGEHEEPVVGSLRREQTSGVLKPLRPLRE